MMMTVDVYECRTARSTSPADDAFIVDIDSPLPPPPPSSELDAWRVAKQNAWPDVRQWVGWLWDGHTIPDSDHQSRQSDFSVSGWSASLPSQPSSDVVASGVAPASLDAVVAELSAAAADHSLDFIAAADHSLETIGHHEDTNTCTTSTTVDITTTGNPVLLHAAAARTTAANNSVDSRSWFVGHVARWLNPDRHSSDLLHASERGDTATVFTLVTQHHASVER